MAYRANVVRFLTAIGQQKWDQLEIASCYLSYPWLEAAEAYYQPIVYYVTIEDENQQVVAVAPCYHIAGPTITPRYNVRDLLAGSHVLADIRACLPQNLQEEQERRSSSIREELGPRLFPCLLCTSLQGYVSSPLFRKRLTPEEQTQIAQILLEAVIQLGAGLRCRVTTFLYVRESEAINAFLAKRVPLRLELEPNAMLALPQGEFQDYLNLFSAKRRQSIRREMRRFADSELRLTVHPLSELSTELLADLFHSVQGKYGLASARQAEQAAIERLKRIALPSRVYLADEHERPVAFSLFFHYQDSWYARITGADYTSMQHTFCHFQLLYYQPISDAMKQGIRTIHYGLASPETKLNRGCTFEPTYGYFYLYDDTQQDLLQASADTISLAQRRYHEALQSLSGHKV